MTVILKVTAPNRSTGTDKSWYLSPSTEVPVDDSEAGGPGNPTIPVINSVGRIEGAISRTILHEAQGISSSTQGEVSVTLQNDPAGTEGPLDEWDDYVLDDAVVRLHIDGSVVWTGAHRGEPLFSRTTNGGGTVTSVLAKPSGPDIQLMRLAGVSNAVRRLTTAIRAAEAPSDAAYDVTSWTVVSHWTGTLEGRVFGRHSGTDWQVLTGRFSGSGNVRVWVYDSGSVQHKWDLGVIPTNRPFHRLVVSVEAASRVLIELNGTIVVDEAIAWTPVVATSSVIRLGGSDSGSASTSWGWVFLDRAMTESEMKSATLSSLEDEPALVSLWRGDDGAGSTIVDSGPLGNDATISGVENTNWEWAPADSGELEQEGDLVPRLWGHGRQLPSKIIDSARNRLIVAQSVDDIATATVREGGEPISPTALETSGIVDLAGTPSKPVTVDTAKSTTSPYDVIADFLDDVWPVGRDEEDWEDAADMDNTDSRIYLTEESSVSEVLTESLFGIGSWWDIAHNGNLTAGHLTLPAPKPPTQNSYIQAYLDATTGNSITGGTYTGWFLIREAGGFTNTPTNQIGLDLLNGPALRIDFQLNNGWPREDIVSDVVYKGDTASSFGIDIRGAAVRNVWCFFAVRISDNAGQADIVMDMGPLGGSLDQMSFTSTESPTFTGKPYALTTRQINVSDLAVYDTVLSNADVAALHATTKIPTDIASLDLHAPAAIATESGGAWSSEVTTGPGEMDVGRGNNTIAFEPHEPVVQPEATWNLSTMPGVSMDVERIPSASLIRVRHNKAVQILNESDLTATITDADKRVVLREWDEATAANEQDSSEQERVILVDSIQGATDSVSRMQWLSLGIADLFKAGNYLAKISGLPRSAIGLSPHAEIRVTDADGQDWTIRVLSRATNNVLDADTSGEILGLARKD